MKIYTKTGDKGETSLLGGKRVSKTDTRIEAMGVIDELNAWMGLIGDSVSDNNLVIEVRKIQADLFTLGANLAGDEKFKNKVKSSSSEQRFSFPILAEKDVVRLENNIDNMTSDLLPLQNFILPGGEHSVSYCHLARAVCRRAERVVIRLSEKIEIDDLIIKYLNRLSDYLFTLARKIAKDNNIDEIEWKG